MNASIKLADLEIQKAVERLQGEILELESKATMAPSMDERQQLSKHQELLRQTITELKGKLTGNQGSGTS